MPLLHEFEQQGNFLFRNRGNLPLLVVAAGVPVAYFTGKNCPPDAVGFNWYEALCLFVSLSGFVMRVFTVGF
ncbi:MAG TPA: lipid A phosphate methyltransferase, partial [Bacteroidia bacterium]|nr:lipid A phosphate methyltransferase [Bacteroidia bacterium]